MSQEAKQSLLITRAVAKFIIEIRVLGTIFFTRVTSAQSTVFLLYGALPYEEVDVTRFTTRV